MKQIWHKSQVHDSVRYRFLWREGELVALDSTKEAIYNEVVTCEGEKRRKSYRERKRLFDGVVQDTLKQSILR
jgi:hypothetical protein